MNCCCFSPCDSYCCPCAPPGYLNQPFHVPGYLGHCPTMRDRIGGSFGRLSRNILEDPCAVAAPCPILAPDCQNQGCCCIPYKDHAECRFGIRGGLSPRCCLTDVYRCGEPMNESYKGHIPGFFDCTHCPSNVYGRSTLSTNIFINDAGYYNMKFKFRDGDPNAIDISCSGQHKKK